jgi:hypothetical protein
VFTGVELFHNHKTELDRVSSCWAAENPEMIEKFPDDLESTFLFAGQFWPLSIGDYGC